MMIAILGTFGCASHVFNNPMTISTKVGAAKNLIPIQTVRAESNHYFFILIPIVPDPRDMHDDLLEEAKKVGGNAVVDYQIRNSSTFCWMFPGIVVVSMEGVGTAVKFE